jgi:nucleoid-associated protein YgaU
MALPLRIEPIEYQRRWDTAPQPVRLRLVVGGKGATPARLHASVYRRRRVAAAVLMVVLFALGSLAVRAIEHTGNQLLPSVPAAAQQVASSVPADAPGTLRGQVLVPGGTYVAQRGDTMWVIARAIKPSGELSGVLRRLVRLNGGPSLEVGQRVVLPR